MSLPLIPRRKDPAYDAADFDALRRHHLQAIHHPVRAGEFVAAMKGEPMPPEPVAVVPPALSVLVSVLLTLRGDADPQALPAPFAPSDLAETSSRIDAMRSEVATLRILGRTLDQDPSVGLPDPLSADRPEHESFRHAYAAPDDAIAAVVAGSGRGPQAHVILRAALRCDALALDTTLAGDPLRSAYAPPRATRGEKRWTTRALNQARCCLVQGYSHVGGRDDSTRRYTALIKDNTAYVALDFFERNA